MGKAERRKPKEGSGGAGNPRTVGDGCARPGADPPAGAPAPPTQTPAQAPPDSGLAFDAVFEHAPLAMLLLDHAMVVRRANRAAAALAGDTQASVIGRRCGDYLTCLNHLTSPEGCGRGDDCRNCVTRNAVLACWERGEPSHRKEARVFFRREGRDQERHLLVSANQVPTDAGPLILVCLEDVTARQAAETARRDSEHRYRLLFERMLDGFALHEIIRDESGRPCDYRFLSVNPAFEFITGLSADAVIGRTVRQVLPAIEPAWVEAYSQAAQSGQPIRFEQFASALGKWFEVNAFATQPGQFGVAFRDITQRKQLESERDLHLRLLQALNSSRGLGEVIQECTRLLQEWTGCQAVGVRLRQGQDYPYFETRGFPPEFVRDENFLCQRDAQGQPRVEGGSNPVLECMCGNVLCGRFDPAKPYFTSRGSFWTNSTTALLASTKEADRQACTRNRCHSEGYESVALVALRAGGAVHGLLQFNDRRPDRFSPHTLAVLEQCADSLASTIAHRLTEEQLRFHSDVLDQIADTITVTDLHGRITYVNARQTRLLGWSKAELLGRPVQAYGDDPARGARQREIVEQTLAQGQWRGEVINYDHQGRAILMECSTFLVRDSAGQPVAMCGIGRDITEQRRAEERSQRQQAELTHLQRVASVGEMASGLAHELNQPLMAIMTYAGVADSVVGQFPGSPPRLLEAVTGIAREADRAAQIVSRVRRFVRKQETTRSAVDLPALVREALDLLDPDLRRARVQVAVTAAADLPQVCVNAVEIQEVMVNLVRNAAEAMADNDPGQRQVAIAIDAEGRWLRVRVSDRGCGMTPADLARAFDSFFTTKPHGLGLGLTICRSLIEAHGGSITAQPNPERGMTIEFTLPVP